jgi:hypothetical protein
MTEAVIAIISTGERAIKKGAKNENTNIESTR